MKKSKTKKTARKPSAKKSTAKKHPLKTPQAKAKPRAKAKAKPRASTQKPPASDSTFSSSLALYVYGITEATKKPIRVTSEGVDGHGAVEGMSEGKFVSWVSRVPRQEFAVELQKHMENLEWLAACSIRHQKVLSEIGAVTQVLPARFGTVFLSPESMLEDLRGKSPRLGEIFRRIANADEWGVKVFGAAQPQTNAAVTAASGSEYLRKKMEAIHTSPRVDEALQRFGVELGAVSEATVAGGKASATQPGLLWSGSFLVKRVQKAKFENVLKRYASEWAPSRRIDISGPWPPYSFVNDNQ